MVEYSPVDEFSGFGMVKSKMAAINFFYSCHLNEGNTKLQYSGVSGIQVSSNQVVTIFYFLFIVALYKSRFDDSADLDPEARLLRYQTLKCPDCNVVEVDATNVGIHKAKSHPGYLEVKLRLLGVEATLKPSVKIVHVPIR